MKKEDINDIITILIMFVLTIGASYMAYHMSGNLSTYTNTKFELNTNHNTINNPLTQAINNNYKPMSNNTINNPLAKAVNDYYNNKQFSNCNNQQKDYSSLFINQPKAIKIPDYMKGFLQLQQNSNKINNPLSIAVNEYYKEKEK